MLVDSMMIAPGPNDYYDPAFRLVLEDHMAYLRNLPSTVLLSIDPSQAYKFEYDLFGLLARYNIPTYMHWIVMRINKMTSPDEITADATNLLVPDSSVIERIRQAHVTKRRIS